MHPNHTTNNIPYGYCHCGCGKKTPLAKSNNAKRQEVKGQPFRFLQGHGTRRPAKLRFWEKVDKRGIDDCWPWTGAQDGRGYGRFWDGQKHTTAHRFVFKLYHGNIPNHILACHKCDNPSCCNPHHLFAGTDADNAADKVQKGRQRNTPAPGEKNPKAKVSSADVICIRQQYADGASIIQLASAYSLSSSNIACIVRRKTWKHI